MGWRFQSFGINELELVDLRFSNWNPLITWLRGIEAIKSTEWV